MSTVTGENFGSSEGTGVFEGRIGVGGPTEGWTVKTMQKRKMRVARKEERRGSKASAFLISNQVARN